MKIDPADHRHYVATAAATGDPDAAERRETAILSGLIEGSEDVMALVTGLHDARTWLIALTDRRILMLSRRFLSAPRRIDIPLVDVEIVDGLPGWIFGALYIGAGPREFRIDNVPKKAVGPFVDKACEWTANAKKADLRAAPITSERVLGLHIADLLT